MKYSMVLFDLDGTVLNTLEDLCDSLNYTLETCGFPVCSIYDVRKFVGNGIHRLIELAVPEYASGKDIETAYSLFIEHYNSNCCNKTYPYDGVISMLNTLKVKGFKTAILSNKADSAVKLICNYYFNDLIDIGLGSRNNIAKKPAPDAVFEIMDMMQCSSSDIIYVGDSEVDYYTAQNSGIDCILVSWGFRDPSILKALSSDVLIANSSDELLKYILIE
jgi:phosphoglycolate phosphatase